MRIQRNGWAHIRRQWTTESAESLGLIQTLGLSRRRRSAKPAPVTKAALAAHRRAAEVAVRRRSAHRRPEAGRQTRTRVHGAGGYMAGMCRNHRLYRGVVRAKSKLQLAQI